MTTIFLLPVHFYGEPYDITALGTREPDMPGLWIG
jgi:hypothetical protein